MIDTKKNNLELKQSDAYQSAYLVCDNCYYYPLEPVHGHYACSSCRLITKCCEGSPLEI